MGMEGVNSFNKTISAKISKEMFHQLNEQMTLRGIKHPSVIVRLALQEFLDGQWKEDQAGLLADQVLSGVAAFRRETNKGQEEMMKSFEEMTKEIAKLKSVIQGTNAAVIQVIENVRK